MRNVRCLPLGLRACLIALLLLLALGAGAALAHKTPAKHPVTVAAPLPLSGTSATARHHKAKPVKKTAPATPGIRDIPVSFKVVNDNTSMVPCTGDGKTYTVNGTLVLPAGTTPAGVTLYAHGLGFGSYFWHFTAVPGYDYVTTEAKSGHASLTIDRLGYGASPLPDGNKTCVGTQATMLHEIVQDLRDGDYSATGATAPPSFSKVGLVGHSAGGELAEVEAYSFKDISALGVVEWNDGDYSPDTYGAFGSDVAQCSAGGKDQVGTTNAGYAKFGATDTIYNQLMFAGVAPNVEGIADRARLLDPCGLVETVLNAVAVDTAMDSSITVPIIYVHATEDGIFPIGVPWAAVQEQLYTHSAKLTDLNLPGAGHAVTLESASAGPFAAAMNTWLTANGL